MKIIYSIFFIFCYSANLKAYSSSNERKHNPFNSSSFVSGLVSSESLRVDLEGNLKEGKYKGEEKKISLMTPLLKKATWDLATSFQYKNIHFNKNIKLNNEKEVSKDLFKTNLSLKFSKKLANYKRFGMNISGGYATDKVSEKTKDYSFNINYMSPSKEGTWIFFLFYSNNSTLGDNIPIPGFFYIKKSKNFTGIYGFPILALKWNSDETPLSYGISFFGTNLSSEISYGEISKLQSYFTASLESEKFIPKEREKDRTRLTIEEKKLKLGIKKSFNNKLLFNIYTGYAFDRFIYIGDKTFEKKGGKAHLKNGSFVGTSIHYIF